MNATHISLVSFLNFTKILFYFFKLYYTVRLEMLLPYEIEKRRQIEMLFCSKKSLTP